MYPQYQICCSYATDDSVCANVLEDYLIKKGYTVFPKQFFLHPGQEYNWETHLRNANLFLVILSEAAVIDSLLLAQISFAKDNDINMLPIVIDNCKIPFLIRNIQSFHLPDGLIATPELSKLNEIISRIIDKQSFTAALQASPMSVPERKVSTTFRPKNKNVFKTILDSINPFKKTGDTSLKNVPAGRGYSESVPARIQQRRADIPANSPVSKKPGLQKNSKINPTDKSLQGKILYDIPDEMKVNLQHKCVVRIGKNEAIVLDDDSFSPAVKIETIPVSKVMEVDLIDISAPPRFIINKISSVEQLVEADSFSEWSFIVTPLSIGMFRLILKVSVIKVVDGKERRKELVFEKSVNISTQPSSTNEKVFKDLAAEDGVKEMDAPVVFISYAHNDKVYFDIFLQYLQSQSNWTFWTDRNIEIGAGWYQSIQQSVKDANVAVLLISANFISSAFIKEHEVAAFSRLKADKPRFNFLPILLRDVDFTRWQELASMQLFVAYGDEYGVPDKKGELIPFAKLCHFDNNGQLIPNDNLDTYFKNLVKKAEKDWLVSMKI